MRRALVGICLAALVAGGGCGADDTSTDEYVERLTVIIEEAGGQYEALVASSQGRVLVATATELSEYTPQDLQAALERVAGIQAEAMGDIAAIEPPERLADLHSLFFRELPLETVAARAGTAADWEELSESAEMEAYRAALVADIEVCTEFEAVLDGGDFAIAAWLSAELKEISDVLLGCTAYPENPQDIYRPPPTTTP